MFVDPPESPILIGALAARPRARELARETALLLERYARDIVAEFGLCPHLREIEGSIGALVVALDRELDASLAARTVRASGRRIAHVVFPLASAPAAAFERFGNELHERLRADAGPRLVHATFHPEMEGGTEYPSRLVGLVRRAPDPFVQLIPHGVQQGGTTMAGTPPLAASFLTTTYERLRGVELERLVTCQRALRDERRRRYARFADELGAFPW